MAQVYQMEHSVFNSEIEQEYRLGDFTVNMHDTAQIRVKGKFTEVTVVTANHVRGDNEYKQVYITSARNCVMCARITTYKIS